MVSPVFISSPWEGTSFPGVLSKGRGIVPVQVSLCDGYGVPCPREGAGRGEEEG